MGDALEVRFADGFILTEGRSDVASRRNPTHTHTPTLIYMKANTDIHTYTHAHTHIHTHTL